MGVEQVSQIETGFLVLQYDNSSSSEQVVSREVDVNCIQFHFCFKGGASFSLIMAVITYRYPTNTFCCCTTHSAPCRCKLDWRPKPK